MLTCNNVDYEERGRECSHGNNVDYEERGREGQFSYPVNAHMGGDVYMSLLITEREEGNAHM